MLTVRGYAVVRSFPEIAQRQVGNMRSEENDRKEVAQGDRERMMNDEYMSLRSNGWRSCVIDDDPRRDGEHR